MSTKDPVTLKLEPLRDNLYQPPRQYWAWQDDRLIYLGFCENFDDAAAQASKLAPRAVWIFSYGSLLHLKEQIERALS